MKLNDLDRLLEVKQRRVPAALITDFANGKQAIFSAESPAGLSPDARKIVAQAIIDDRSGEHDLDGKPCFVLVQNPPARLMIVGAVHISQSLAPMAAMAGYDVTVIDPRRAFATEQRFPGVKLRHDWPDEAMAELDPDVRSAVVTLTHDPKLDDPALAAALRAPVFYIGALGSKKTHAARLERLAAAGFGAADFARIHGPAGLDIGAKSPAEIAVSVLAQLTAARRSRSTGR